MSSGYFLSHVLLDICSSHASHVDVCNFFEQFFIGIYNRSKSLKSLVCKDLSQ